MPFFSNRRYIDYLLPVISGVFTGISLLYCNIWLAWIMLIPLYYSIIRNPKKSFLKGAISGVVTGFILFSWMISSARYYTGTSTYIGFSLWTFSSVYFGLLTGLCVWAFSLSVKNNHKGKNSWLINSLLAGAIWVSIDWFRARIMSGLPWLHYQFAITQSSFNTPLQLISFTGIGGMTFIIVIINVFIAYILFQKKYKLFWIPIMVYSIVFSLGLVRLNIFGSKKAKDIKVTLICENIEARQRWLPETGDSLVKIYFDLNKQAVKMSPQLIVWSESAIPWDFSTNDDLITKCLAITWPIQAGHIIGTLSPSDKQIGKRYNSAYYIEPDGAITSRYDKVQLLSFLEKPFAGEKLPFFNRSAHTDILAGEKRRLLKTPYGNAGILICNETLTPQPYKETIKLGADFFVVMANNSWFEGSQLIKHHFYGNRLRTIESGIDMIINCNRGISGIINADGTIQVSNLSLKPTIVSGVIHKRHYKSFYSQFGDWFVLLTSIFLVSFSFYLIKQKKSQPK